MAFFPRNFYGDASFTPLFRLLDDFDNYSRQGQTTGRRTGFQHWQPKFDVREVADAYELNGELPGLTKENVQIEFTEPQTMLVRGKAERSHTSGTPPAALVEDSTMSGAITEGEEPTSSHHATVEDESEADAPTPASTEPASTEVAQNTEQEKPAAEKAKYWLSERSVGEFARSFSFPARVDQDAVSANMKDGILTIRVPKAKKHESRRISVE